MSKKKGKFISNLMGISNIKMGFSYTKYSLARLVNRSVDDRVETFEEACIRFNIIGSHDVVNPIFKKKFNEYKKSFYIKLFLSVLTLTLGTYYLFTGATIINVMMCFLLSFSVFTFALPDALNCHHINKRELGLVKQWIRKPTQWFPRKFNEIEWSVTAPEKANTENLEEGNK